jgi:hypothetical protein
VKNDEEDLLAAFSASATVDASSYYPPPSAGSSRINTPDSFAQRIPRAYTPQAVVSRPAPEPNTLEEDDPFGLGEFEQRRQAATTQATAEPEDDDFMGLLGQPVSKPTLRQAAVTQEDDEYVASANSDPRDAAVAELVDMGFSAEKAKDALEATDFDVQSAVGLILNQAHEQSKSKQISSQNPSALAPEARRQPARTNSRGRDPLAQETIPSWMKAGAGQGRTDSDSPVSSERDVAQYATEIGSTLFKSANSLFKAGRKQVQKAMADLQETDANGQPRWMQNPAGETSSKQQPPARPSQQQVDVTDEAMMLESGRSTPASRPERRAQAQPPRDLHPPDRLPSGIQRRPSPLAGDDMMRPPPRREQPPQRPVSRPAEKINRLRVEEQSAQAYISPARRKKAQPPSTTAAVEAPTPSLLAEPDMDIFSEEQPLPASARSLVSSARPAPQSLPIRPKMTSRAVPSVSNFVLSASASDRQKGTEAFKRGDYGEAQTHYTSAMSGLPSTHPITIIILCNRALTNIKTGDPKAAVIDADSVLKTIGPGRGEEESISLGDAEGDKPMKEFYGKALMRKAEAYEHMEKWSEAAGVWRDAVEAGVGGSVSIQGRNRCEKAAGPGTSSTVANVPVRTSVAPKRMPTPAQPARRAVPASAALSAHGGGESDAVKRLRAANAAAAAASDEAFALNDAVEARLNAWKQGKEGNLRALLGSLDTILWPEADWRKIGMSDLVMFNKVKINYMKAIAKVHPDKVCSKVCNNLNARLTLDTAITISDHRAEDD